MKRALKEEEWPTVLDRAEELLANGADFGEVRGVFSKLPWGLVKEDVGAVEPKVRMRWKRRTMEERDWEEMDDSRAAEAPSSKLQAPITSGFLAQLCDIIHFLTGEGVADARVVWRRGKERVLRPGDVARVVPGPGRDFLVCAVEIARVDGSVEVLPEYRIKSQGKVRLKYVNRRLELEVLTLEGKAHNPAAVMRRLAAVKMAYFGKGSGMENGAELARINGTSKQAVNDQMAALRRQHERRTGDGGERVGGAVPARGRRAAGSSKFQVPSSNEPQTKGEAERQFVSEATSTP